MIRSKLLIIIILGTTVLSSCLSVVVFIQQMEISSIKREQAAALSTMKSQVKLDQSFTEKLTSLWKEVYKP